jgi:uncharacterized protein YukE
MQAAQLANYSLGVAQEAQVGAQKALAGANSAVNATEKAVNDATSAVTNAANSVAHWGSEAANWTKQALSAQNMMNAANSTINACNSAINQCNNAINSAEKAIEDAANKAWKTISNPKKWFSDVRLKENVEFAGIVAGLNTYTYNYVWSNEKHTGVMAQELLDTDYADAVSVHESGYYQVDYNKLPI